MGVVAATAGVVATTEGDPRTQGRPEPAGGAERRAAKPAPARLNAHPLLRVFPLTVMAVATFLTVFTLMMARMTALQASSTPAGGSVVALARGSAPLRTRASGAAASGAAASGAGVSGALARTSPQEGATILTRTSGAGFSESHDD